MKNMKGIKENIKAFFKGWTVFEAVFAALSIVSSVVLTTIFKSGVLSCATSILTIMWCLFLAKGKVAGHIVGIAATILYTIVSFKVAYYGEVIISLGITIPMSTWAFVTWLTNKRKDEKQGEVVIVKKISSRELALLLVSQVVMGVGYYFLLKAFNTEFLIVSTASLIANIIATYLLIRRSETNWIVWIINSIITLALWLYLAITKDLSHLTLTVMAGFLLVNNVYGAINWERLKKGQK